ncbi:M4 family metallopeptidase [Saccharicrinis sp. FJH54]|uniref:M4 family metallopeptidase n=1 Tax=Saccharicrinis sp. FJH54 TaxID=3344665 RepID=UPI0035D4D3FE
MTFKLYPILLSLFVVASVAAQQNSSFKTVNKNASGTAATQLQYKTINGTVQTKSASFSSSSAFSVSKNLKQPGLNQDNRIKNLIKAKGLPVFFEVSKPDMQNKSAKSPEQQFYEFHKSVQTTTRLNDPEKELIIRSVTTDNLGMTHIKAQQYYKGIEVYGGESFLHIKTDKDLFNGKICLVDPDVRTVPVLTEKEALEKVKNDITSKTICRTIPESHKILLSYEPVKPGLIIYENRLAYRVEYRPNIIEEWIYFIDARDGSVIKSYNNTKSDGPVTATATDLNNVQRTINTYLEKGTYYMMNISEPMFNNETGEGQILTLNGQNTSTQNLDYIHITSANNTWNNPTAVSAHYNATTSYLYYKNTFNRNSINGQGGNIISLINIANDDGSSMENAFWNGKAAFYGNGGVNFKPLAGALDVTAHELGHGIVSNTANLEYQGQSGAINESYADIFGSMVDREDWLIGEDITKTTFSPSGALRNMADPHNMGTSLNDPYWQPAHLKEMYIGNQDNGGVHINSGIGNHAYYLFATAVTKSKAEQVFYRALTTYLTSKSQFTDFRIAVIQAAKDLYGESSTEVTKAGEAFDAVGIYEQEVIDYEQDYNTNQGDEYLLTYNTSLSFNFPHYLYRSNVDATNFIGLTFTDMKGKASVTDNGVDAVFVDQNDYIKYLSLDPNNPAESYLSQEAFWDNVAFSKDGNRIAAISTEVDTAIYIYDFNAEQWAKYRLYNPTTSHSGENAGGVLYADAIEFDFSGEYVMYDAYNELNSDEGNDISYWDIGFIRVWDNENNTFGDGTITKMYGSLPENVSIGNPVFSKNSPYIIAFDYFDNVNEEYAVLGANLVTGDLDVIANNATIGYPSFSSTDDKIAYSALATDDSEVVAEVSLADNKISSVGNPVILVNDARWPVYYAVGSRSLQLAPVANFTADYLTGTAPLQVRFIDQSINSPETWQWSFQGGTPSTSAVQNPVITYNNPGIYQVSLTCINDAGQNTMTKSSYINVVATGLEKVAQEIISFYPNPANDKLFINTDKSYQMKIYDTSGKLVLEASNSKNIDISPLESGIYILKIDIEDTVLTNKLVKE